MRAFRYLPPFKVNFCKVQARSCSCLSGRLLLIHEECAACKGQTCSADSLWMDKALNTPPSQRPHETLERLLISGANMCPGLFITSGQLWVRQLTPGIWMHASLLYTPVDTWLHHLCLERPNALMLFSTNGTIVVANTQRQTDTMFLKMDRNNLM